MGVCSIRQFLVVIYLSSFMIARSLCRIRPPGIALPRQFHRSLRAVSSTAGTPSTIARAQQLEYGQQSIEIAGRTIAKGGLVAFPTETVYGLGANALMEKSVQAIFTAKLRPNSDPLIVHIADTSMMDILFDFEASTEGAAAKRVCMTLAQAFWPGPLTIVCKASQRVPAVVCAGTGYVGVRCPSHSIALSLLRASGVPIAAPSANRFGHVSPTSAAHVMDDLGHCDIMILADQPELTGGCKVGVESTVCKVSNDGRLVSILRCGAVTSSMMRTALVEQQIQCVVETDNERHLHKKEHDQDKSDSSVPSEAAVAPGQMLKHYAPDLPTFIVSSSGQAGTEQTPASYDHTCAMVIDFGAQLAHLQPVCRHYVDLSCEGSAAQACNRLFDTLRSAESAQLRALGVTHVLLPDLRALSSPAGEEGKVMNPGGTSKDELLSALWERLHRAASGTFIIV